jgi:hypothetical protein
MHDSGPLMTNLLTWMGVVDPEEEAQVLMRTLDEIRDWGTEHEQKHTSLRIV